MNWFFERYGIRPKKADDPMRLGRRRRKRQLICAATLGAATIALYHERAWIDAGSQSLNKFVEIRYRDDAGSFVKDVIAISTVIFITSSNASYPLPTGWNPGANSIECIGGGQGGTVGSTFISGCCFWPNGGTGGTGGGYAKSSNVNVSGTINAQIGAGGVSSGGTGGNTTVNSTTVVARGGGTGTAQVGNVATRLGGAGGTAPVGVNFQGGGGGGGAAGPNAVGNGGSNASASFNGGAGGAGDGGSGGAGGPTQSTANANGNTGGNGAEYTATAGGTAGSGGGGSGCGGGGGSTQIGGTGGLYGGAGGGGMAGTAGTGGTARQGLIVLTFTPLYMIGKRLRVYLRR